MGCGSSPNSKVPHVAQLTGLSTTIWLTDSTGLSDRPCPGWPVCPPAFRPEGGGFGRGGALGGSDDGGFDELRDVWLTRSSSSARRFWSAATVSSRDPTSCCTADGVAAQSSAEMPGRI